MTRVAVSRLIPAPRGAVWHVLADLGTHSEWMRDSRSIEFTGQQTRGVGTRMKVMTVVGPFRTTDIMEVVAWDEGELIEVRHEGVVTGQGILAVQPEAGSTLVTWTECLRFPWWLGGPVAAWLARPVLTAIWRANLRRLEEMLTH